MRKFLGATLLVAALVASASAGVVTGNPVADGWTLHGHSLANGVYSRGTANYGYNIYSSAIHVANGSNLAISDGGYSWLPGDTVLGIGGVFTGISAASAGWGSISGNSVNSQLSQALGPKLIAKFGTSAATFSTSTIAPGAGNGAASTALAGTGGVFVRTSGYFHATNPLLSQDTDTTWTGNNGQLMLLDKDNHISRNGTSAPDKRVARVIWEYDTTLGHVLSWQILLNVSLLDRTAGGFGGLTPRPGDLVIASVQDRDGVYTDSLVRSVIPAPGAVLLGALGLGLIARLRRHVEQMA
ncbi:MAG: hypothetical protein IPM18_01685 [Phycisphaerales bacterium]|nr:hypothetical protein [Phycisphaerales bacterium]